MALHELEHEHTALARAVAALHAMGTRAPRDAFLAKLDALVTDLFEHFAREEEGLFPYITAHLPDQAAAVADLQAAHDRICGAASRILSLAPEHDELAASLFERFEVELAAHAEREVAFLRALSARLTPDEHAEVAALLRGL